MIDARLLRTDLAALTASLSRRGSSELIAQVEQAAALDAQARALAVERDELRATINELSREVGLARRAGDAESAARADELMERSRERGAAEAELAARHDVVAEELRQLLLTIPNVPSELAPDGAGDDDNPVVRGPIGMPASSPTISACRTGRSASSSGCSTTSGRSRSPGRCSR